MHLQAKALGHGGGAFDLQQAFGRTGKAQASDFFPVDGLAGFCFQPVIELDAALKHAGDVAG